MLDYEQHMTSRYSDLNIRYIPTLNSRKRGGRDLYRATPVVAQDLGFLRSQGGWGGGAG